VASVALGGNQAEMSDASQLPEHVRRAIYGEMTAEEKCEACDKSLNNWCAAGRLPAPWQEVMAYHRCARLPAPRLRLDARI